jgi:hypothetical protein
VGRSTRGGRRHILGRYKTEGYSAKCVDSKFEDGGRWTNYETNVYEVVEDGGKAAYFSVWREVPATECQDGGDFMISITEVVPQLVMTTEYVPGRSA